MKSVVVLIIAHKCELSSSEIASLKQCHKVLGNHRIVIICPKGLNVAQYNQAVPSLEFDFIRPKWLSSFRMSNRLKMAPLLYKKYRANEYILFYELDAWVFRDELEYWCDQGYDYIGAPWFEGGYLATAESKFIGIGNGGFSLRKVKSHLQAIHHFSYVQSPKVLWENFRLDKRLRSAIVLLLNLTVRNNTFFLFNNLSMHDDVFWGIVGERFHWRIPDISTAAQFSMEVNARMLYNMNNNCLPFGCHKWEKYDIDFWRQFIR